MRIFVCVEVCFYQRITNKRRERSASRLFPLLQMTDRFLIFASPSNVDLFVSGK